MGKRLIIVGANFAENKIEQEPIPQEVKWSIGTISSTGVIGAEANGIHTNLLDIRSASEVSIIVDALALSDFSPHGAAAVVALYDNSGTFITRIAAFSGESTHVIAETTLSSYPTANKVRFVIAAYANDVTNVDVALSQLSYELNGI